MLLSFVQLYMPLLATAVVHTGGVNWTFVLSTIIAVICSGVAVTAYKWAKNQGVKESQQDTLLAILPDLQRVITVVLGDGKDNKGLVEVLQSIKDNQTPNGGTTKSLGDTAKRADDNARIAQETGKRVEGKIDTMSDNLNQHIGQAIILDKLLNGRVDKVETRLTDIEKMKHE